VKSIEEKFASPLVAQFPDFRPGDTVRVHCKITEGAKSRIQEFEGIVIAIKEKGRMNGHFRVRKISDSVGVERVFPYHSPNVSKVELINKGDTRKAKLFYLRGRIGKAARVGTNYNR
jgi:large subunit ribosomal protein L19